MSSSCQLCFEGSLVDFSEANSKSYQLCASCGLITLRDEFHLSFKDEGTHYLSHNNTRESQGYVEFLLKTIEPLNRVIAPGSNGIDFGSGPGPVAAVLLEERGHQMKCYDPHFASEPDVLDDEYDFVLCTEVAEHFRNPRGEFNRINSLLKPAAYLGLMTLLYSPEIDFEKWWYTRDTTHCTFYQLKTLEYIADSLSWNLVFSDSLRVFVFKKTA